MQHHLQLEALWKHCRGPWGAAPSPARSFMETLQRICGERHVSLPLLVSRCSQSPDGKMIKENLGRGGAVVYPLKSERN